ncbi:MAG: hypothetical protein K6G37_00190 [Bacilli bacterium]|nr:hypothetical protein [Bacilli bacterium]
MEITSEQELINYLNQVVTTDDIVVRFDFDFVINLESEVDSIFKLDGFETTNIEQTNSLNKNVKRAKEYGINYNAFAKMLFLSGYQLVFTTYCEGEKYSAKTLDALFKLNRDIELDDQFFVEISKKTRVRKKNGIK